MSPSTQIRRGEGVPSAASDLRHSTGRGVRAWAVGCNWTCMALRRHTGLLTSRGMVREAQQRHSIVNKEQNFKTALDGTGA